MNGSGPAEAGPSTDATVTRVDNGIVAQGSDAPLEAAHPGFRSEQAAWRRRIRCSRRLAPYDDTGRVDPISPYGRWGE